MKTGFWFRRTRAGFVGVDLFVVQPMALEGEAKMLTPLTIENIASSVIEDGLATREEIDGASATSASGRTTPASSIRRRRPGASARAARSS